MHWLCCSPLWSIAAALLLFLAGLLPLLFSCCCLLVVFSVFASSADVALVSEDHSEFSADIASFIEASSRSQVDSDSDSEEAVETETETETETEEAVDSDSAVDAEAEEALSAMRRDAIKRAAAKGKAAVTRVAAKAAAVVKAVAAKAHHAVSKAAKAGHKKARKHNKANKSKHSKAKKGKHGKKAHKGKKDGKGKKAHKGKKGKKCKSAKCKKARKLRKQLRKLKKGGASREAIGAVQSSLKALKKGPVSIAVKQHRIKLKGRTPAPKKIKVHRESPTDRNYIKHLRATKKQWASRIKNLRAKIATLGKPAHGMNDWEIEYSTLDPQDTSQAAMAKELIDEYRPFLKDAKSIKEDDLNNGKHQLEVMEKLRWVVRDKLEKAQDTPLLPEQYRFIE